MEEQKDMRHIEKKKQNDRQKPNYINNDAKCEWIK